MRRWRLLRQRKQSPLNMLKKASRPTAALKELRQSEHGNEACPLRSVEPEQALPFFREWTSVHPSPVTPAWPEEEIGAGEGGWTTRDLSPPYTHTERGKDPAARGTHPPWRGRRVAGFATLKLDLTLQPSRPLTTGRGLRGAAGSKRGSSGRRGAPTRREGEVGGAAGGHNGRIWWPPGPEWPPAQGGGGRWEEVDYYIFWCAI